MKEFIKSTLIGGIVFLLPIAIVMYFAGQAARVLTLYVVQPVSDVLDIGPARAAGVVIAALVLIAFAAGLMARGAIARRLNVWFWDHFPNQPQYEQVRSMALGLEQGDVRSETRAVLVQRDGGFELGLHVETLENGLAVVYVPGVPIPQSGRLLYLPPDQVSPIDLSREKVLAIMRASGAGSAAALRGTSAGTTQVSLVTGATRGAMQSARIDHDGRGTDGRHE